MAITYRGELARGRCNIGDKYVCKDGPVFTLEELQNMPGEY